MGLTAALCGLITALIPVLFSMIHEGLPKRWKQWDWPWAFAQYG